MADTPIDPTDLPGYAGRLFDRYEKHPQIQRLATWHRLERAPTRRSSCPSTGFQIEDIAKAQAEGILPSRFPAGVLLTLVLHLASVWATTTPEFTAAVPLSSTERGAHVAEAVRKLLAG